MSELNKLTAAVLQVGDGRGFVVETLEAEHRLIITAAHCLPFLPPAHPAAYFAERTYRRLLGPLEAEPTVWAECRFIDHVNDIAVLGAPDGQELAQEADRYEALTEAARRGCSGSMANGAAVPCGTSAVGCGSATPRLALPEACQGRQS